jgi:hypothetical protein
MLFATISPLVPGDRSGAGAYGALAKRSIRTPKRPLTQTTSLRYSARIDFAHGSADDHFAPTGRSNAYFSHPQWMAHAPGLKTIDAAAY